MLYLRTYGLMGSICLRSPSPPAILCYSYAVLILFCNEHFFFILLSNFFF